VIPFGVSDQKIEELKLRMQKCDLLDKDIQETFVRSGGKGGQKVNKTSTCVQLKHLPTGLAVKVQKSRSQALNRFYARRRLCELLENRLLGKDSPKAKKISRIRKQKDRRARRRKT
jgi:protein subunit release factor B